MTATTESRTMTQINASTFHGTVKQFVDAKLKVNGHEVDQAGLSVFGRYGMLKVVGEQKPTRGRSAAVYEITTDTMEMPGRPSFSF